MLLALDLLSYSLRRTGWARFVSTFLLFYAQIIASEFLLGSLSALNGLNLGLLNLALSAALIFLLYKNGGQKSFKNYLANIKTSVVDFCKRLKTDPLWCVLILLSVVFIGWIIFLGIIFPATDFDGNSYHLTFIGYVLQNHNFFDAPTSLTWLAGYPKGGEFIQMWSVIITHSDMFADLAQVPFLIFGVYALYEIATRLGGDKKQSRFAALLFLFLPIVLNQLKTTYVDVMLCSLFFGAVAMVIRKKLSTLDLFLFGIICSLIISIKSTGFLFVIVIVPLLFWNLYKNRNKKLGIIKNYFKPLSIIIIPTFFGLYWYVKDFVLYGTPIYPFGFKLAGISIFPGQTFQDFAAKAISQLVSLPKGYFARIWFVWTEQKDWFGCLYNYDTNYAGLGPIWLIILVPSIIMAGYYALKRRSTLFLGVTATIVFLFAIYPSNYYTRYTMFIAAIGIYALSLTLTKLNRLTSNLIKCLILLLVLSVIATNFVLCNFPPRVVGSQLRSVLAGSARGTIYNNIPGSAFVFIENRIQPGETVIYDSSPYFIYPLWRPDFSDKVMFIPASNRDVWYKEVHNKHVRYVFTTINSKENLWAKNGLKSIYKDSMYEIYQVY